jgi:hypothetical protein
MQIKHVNSESSKFLLNFPITRLGSSLIGSKKIKSYFKTSWSGQIINFVLILAFANGELQLQYFLWRAMSYQEDVVQGGPPILISRPHWEKIPKNINFLGRILKKSGENHPIY